MGNISNRKVICNIIKTKKNLSFTFDILFHFLEHFFEILNLEKNHEIFQ